MASVDEVRQAIAQLGERYLRRLFTEHERTFCNQWPDPAPHLAARFAAKEAVIKLLGLTEPQPPWTSIEVRCSGASGEQLVLTGPAALAARERGIDLLKVSLCQCGDNAAAIVVTGTR